MIHYLIINLLIIAVGLFVPEKIKVGNSSSYKDREISIQCLLLFIILFIFLGFRGGFTSDYNSYSSYFVRIYQDISFRDIFSRLYSIENGFILISKIIGCITQSELAYHAILSFGLLILFFRVYNKHSNLLWLTVLLFVNLGDYFGSMNLFRQVLAAAIIFSGFDLIIQKRFISFCLLTVLAATIHTSSLIMIICYFPLVSNRKMFWNLGFGAIFAILWLWLNSIVDFISSVFPRYHDYHYGMGHGSINAVFFIAAIYIFAQVSLKLFVSEYNYDNLYNIVLMNGTLLCLLFLLLGIKVYMFTRIVYFFRPFACLLVPNILSHYSDKKLRDIIIMVISIFCIIYTYITLSGTGYDPYYFYNRGA